MLEKCREFQNWQKTLKRYVSHLPSHGLINFKPRCERKGRRREEMEEEEYARMPVDVLLCRQVLQQRGLWML